MKSDCSCQIAGAINFFAMDEHRFSADLLNFVILSGAFAAKDLCSLVVQKRVHRFFAPLRMTG